MTIRLPADKLDAGPWYKQPWPWILIGLPLSAVLAGVVTLVYAVRSNDGLVADDYYKQGLGINKVIARQLEASRRKIQAELAVDGNNVVVVLSARDGVAMPEEVRLSLAHPTRAGEDEVVVLARRGKVYAGVLKGGEFGPRNVLIEDVAGDWKLSSVGVFPLKETLRIQAASMDSKG